MKTLYRIRLVSLIALVASVAPIASVVPVTSTRIRPISTLNSSGSAESRNSITVHAAGRGNPWLNLSDGGELLTAYIGAATLEHILEQNLAPSLALASTDFDEDGVPDLVPRVEQSTQKMEGVARTFTVTNTNDSGPGSLRQAILDSNGAPSQQTIAFNIGGGGLQTTTPTSPLPAITDPVIIDGTTQPGFAGSPIIDPPIHPGEILLEEFLRPMGISQYQLVREIKVDELIVSLRKLWAILRLHPLEFK